MPPRSKATDQVAAYTALAKSLADIDDQIASLQDRRQVIVTELLRMRPDNGTHDAGDIAITVSRSKRLDLAAIEAKYPYEQRPELYGTPRATASKVRQHIAPADLETFEVETAASVKVK